MTQEAKQQQESGDDGMYRDVRDVEVGQVVWYQSNLDYNMPCKAEVLAVDHRNGIYTLRFCKDLLVEPEEVRCLGRSIHLTEADAWGSLEQRPSEYRKRCQQERWHAKEEQMKIEVVGAVYPSDEASVWVDTEDRYDGAHCYTLRNYLAFQQGKPVYTDTYSELVFAYKNADGEPEEGWLSEQLLLVLLDRHRKLERAFPHPTYHKLRAGLEMALEAQRERVDDRVRRGVMGELKA